MALEWERPAMIIRRLLTIFLSVIAGAILMAHTADLSARQALGTASADNTTTPVPALASQKSDQANPTPPSSLDEMCPVITGVIAPSQNPSLGLNDLKAIDSVGSNDAWAVGRYLPPAY